MNASVGSQVGVPYSRPGVGATTSYASSIQAYVNLRHSFDAGTLDAAAFQIAWQQYKTTLSAQDVGIIYLLMQSAAALRRSVTSAFRTISLRRRRRACRSRQIVIVLQQSCFWPNRPIPRRRHAVARRIRRPSDYQLIGTVIDTSMSYGADGHVTGASNAAVGDGSARCRSSRHPAPTAALDDVVAELLSERRDHRESNAIHGHGCAG